MIVKGSKKTQRKESITETVGSSQRYATLHRI